jgi:hypothetical protein
MATLRVDSLSFHFQASIEATKYDESVHYLTVLQQQGKKAVDVVAIRVGANPDPVWLIEAKDFRNIRGEPKESNTIGLPKSVLQKVDDTREGLRDSATNATDPTEREYAQRAITPQNTKIVLHLEPYQGPATKLLPRNPAAGVLQKLKQLVKHIDPDPRVLNIANTRKAGVPWTVS